MEEHEKYMKIALSLAQEALDAGEVPVGCVFVLRNKIIQTARNETNKSLNGTSHAELVAIRKMDIAQIKNMDLYVTIEPCIMCAGALREVGIKNVYFGAKNDKFGGNGTVLNLHSDKSKYPEYKVTSGLMQNEAITMLRKFYIRENENAPLPRKKTNRILKPVEPI